MDLITRMRQAAPRASIFLLSLDDYRLFVRAWLESRPVLEEAVPTKFEGVPLIVQRHGFRSYVLAMSDPPEIWCL
jgi:hypothetical protein